MNIEKKLRTRFVFIDTCVFISKYFNFGIYSLGRTQRYIEEGKIHLLLPDITKSEIEKNIRKFSEEAYKELLSFIKKDAIKILKCIDYSPFGGEISIPTQEEIYKSIYAKFEAFIDSPNVEVLSTNNVNSKIIFEKYFNSEPPFDKKEKKFEFPDAFVLETINETSRNKGEEIYVISSDNDMKSYVALNPNLLHLNNINELNDLIIHNDENLAVPANFADEAFEYLKEQIIEKAKSKIYESEFEITQLYEYFYDDIINDVEIESIEICEKNLQEVSRTEAEYQVNFNVHLTVEISLPDFESSPWDPEDQRFIYINREKYKNQFQEVFSAYVSLVYEDGIIQKAEISNLSFENSTFELSHQI